VLDKRRIMTDFLPPPPNHARQVGLPVSLIMHDIAQAVDQLADHSVWPMFQETETNCGDRQSGGNEPYPGRK
jgi:hypothetical protein